MLDNRTQDTVSVGEFIMLARRREGLSQRSLSQKSGLSYGYISALELGISINPTVKTITALAVTLNEIIAWDLLRVRLPLGPLGGICVEGRRYA